MIISGSWPPCLWQEHSFELGKCSYFWPLVLRFHWWHQLCMMPRWSRLTCDSLQGDRGIGTFFWGFRLKWTGSFVILYSSFCLIPFAEVLHKTDMIGSLKACYSSPVSTDVGSNSRVTYSSPNFSVELLSLPFAFSIIWKKLRFGKKKKNSTNFLAQDCSFISLLSLSVIQKQSQLHHT